MHTSTVLQSSDFRYRRIAQSESVPTDFDTFFPDYHELDRIGVVSLSLEDGILQAGGTLLALTTAFYDVQRTKDIPFFIYPQHFALLGEGAGRIRTDTATVPISQDVLGSTWGNLDVWPESNWHLAPATVEGMLRKVFDLQINRLFWPEGFLPQSLATRLPNYIGRILRSRLKAVYLTNPVAPTMEVEGTPKVAQLVKRSLDSLPDEAGEAKTMLPDIERFRQVTPTAFLETMSCCFAEEE